MCVGGEKMAAPCYVLIVVLAQHKLAIVWVGEWLYIIL